MTNKTKMLPCPFCGGQAKVSSFPGAHNVWCENQPVSCGNRAMFTVEQWNTRAPAEDVRAVVDEPVAWMSECISGYKKGCVEITDGPGATKNNAYWTPDFPVYRHPQRKVVMPERRAVSEHARDQAMCANAWNACLDEIARLNQ